MLRSNIIYCDRSICCFSSVTFLVSSLKGDVNRQFLELNLLFFSLEYHFGHFSLCMSMRRNGHRSTSGQEPDVTVVFSVTPISKMGFVIWGCKDINNPVSKNTRLSYWNLTSGFDFHLIVVVGMSVCISLLNFIRIGPHRPYHSLSNYSKTVWIRSYGMLWWSDNLWWTSVRVQKALWMFTCSFYL